MIAVPDRINAAWIGSLADSDLVDVELQLHDAFEVLDRQHKISRGSRYTLMRGPPDLVDAWDRWSRLNMALKNRSLAPHRHSSGRRESAKA